MGFYGNITNTSKTTFVFDKIYPNRYAMENKMGSDGVYLGRYVLIEYDEGVSQEDYYKAFFWNPEDSWFYGSPAFEATTKVMIVDSIPSGSPEFLVRPGDIIREKKTETVYTNKYYIVKDNQFVFATDTDSNYVRNFNIDRHAYGESRGWDSTVWIKEYVNKQEKYVQIAELNTVIPSFDITADAPTQSPVTPHFDQNSTNVYYKLHMQPQWGVRVAESSGHSDVETLRETITYDPETGMTDVTTEIIPANIFYNKDGLNVNKPNSKVILDDAVTFLPSGSSGLLYNKHDGSGETETANDIYELSLLLPSFGNTVSDLWNLVYGSVRNQNTEWGNKDGLRLTKIKANGDNSFQPSDTQTFAGCINSVQDMLGTIIRTTLKPAEELAEEDLSYVYFDGTKYHRVHLAYIFTEATEETYRNKELEFFNGDGALWNSNLPYAAGQIFTRSETYEYKELTDFAGKLNTMHGILIKMNNMLEYDSPLTRNKATVQGAINIINDLIDRISYLVPGEFVVVDSNGRMHSAKYEGDLWLNPEIDPAAAAPKVSITHMFNATENTTSTSDSNVNLKDTINLKTPIVDAMGHVTSHNVETVTLPYGMKSVSATNSAAATAPISDVENSIVAKNTMDTLSVSASNKWINMGTNNSVLSVGHALTEATPNTKFGLVGDLSIDDLDEDNTFEVPCFILDEAGHIILAETHTVAVPETFNQISVTGDSAEEIDSTNSSGTISADTLKDILSLNAGNRWIQLKTSGDSVEFRHYVKVFTETAESVDLEDAGGFPVQELIWDKAGHLISSVKKQYALPDRFKGLQVDYGTSEIEVASLGTPGRISAKDFPDFHAEPKNYWITTSVDANTLRIGHRAPSPMIKNTAGESSDKTLTFGGSFVSPFIGIDATGHTSKLYDSTMTLPIPSLANGIGNVVTSITLNPTSGAMAEIKDNVGQLSLVDYSLGDSIDTVVTTDTINSAFGKIQSNLNVLKGSATKEGSVAYQIAQVVAGADTSFDTLKEIADWIKSDSTGAAAMQNSIIKNTLDIAELQTGDIDCGIII